MATEPLPPPGPDVLSRLRRELWFARDAGETRRVQELTRQIGRLTTGAEPAPETTMAAPPQRETTARPKPAPKPRPAAKRAARKQTPRSPRVPRQ